LTDAAAAAYVALTYDGTDALLMTAEHALRRELSRRIRRGGVRIGQRVDRCIVAGHAAEGAPHVRLELPGVGERAAPREGVDFTKLGDAALLTHLGSVSAWRRALIGTTSLGPGRSGTGTGTETGAEGTRASAMPSWCEVCPYR